MACTFLVKKLNSEFNTNILMFGLPCFNDSSSGATCWWSCSPVWSEMIQRALSASTEEKKPDKVTWSVTINLEIEQLINQNFLLLLLLFWISQNCETFYSFISRFNWKSNHRRSVYSQTFRPILLIRSIFHFFSC